MYKDITSYSRGDKERKPKVLECQLTPNISFKIHKHIYCGDAWFLKSNCIRVEMMDLGTTDLEEAKRKALDVMLQKLAEKKDEAELAMEKLAQIGESLDG